MNNELLNEEQKKFLLSIYKGKRHRDITNLLNLKFKTDIKESQIKRWLSSRRLKTGYDGRFYKGFIPYNKGIKTGRVASSCFKKGHIPANRVPIGTERIDADGYIKVKIAENKWVMKHRLVWERIHKRTVPDGYFVTFLDGNKLNFDKDNLVLISRAENMFLNKRKLRSKNAKITETGLIIAKVLVKRSELRK